MLQRGGSALAPPSPGSAGVGLLGVARQKRASAEAGLCRLTACGLGERAPKERFMTGTQLYTDRQLQQSVLAELTFEPTVDTAHIGVSARDGVVTLSGLVQSWVERWEAERAALRVAGVQAVVDDIAVDLPATHVRADLDLARSALQALANDVSVPGSIKVTVKDGVLTLRGEVDWHPQRWAAEDCVRALTGVRGVINLIDIRPLAVADQRDVKQEIARAFQRHATLDADHIQVELAGDTVILRGDVRSWLEREDAEQAAWAAKGVSAVENHLTIQT